MSKYKVLLADDPGLRKPVGTTPGTEDFALYHASDGQETLGIARAEQPDMILLDISMPRKNGLEVCREVKAGTDTAGAKVLMVTASGSEADKSGASAARADDYFIKPFSPVALLSKIYELLG